MLEPYRGYGIAGRSCSLGRVMEPIPLEFVGVGVCIVEPL